VTFQAQHFIYFCCTTRSVAQKSWSKINVKTDKTAHQGTGSNCCVI